MAFMRGLRHLLCWRVCGVGETELWSSTWLCMGCKLQRLPPRPLVCMALGAWRRSESVRGEGVRCCLSAPAAWRGVPWQGSSGPKDHPAVLIEPVGCALGATGGGAGRGRASMHTRASGPCEEYEEGMEAVQVL